ncbi:hypothetical protein BG011_006643, partial [Mortierella polycephala]
QSKNGEMIEASVQPFYPTDIIKNEVSGKYMDNFEGAVTTQDNPDNIWPCKSSANQVWKFKEGTTQLAFGADRKSGTYCQDI